MSTFSPWFHGTPSVSPSAYSDMGSMRRVMNSRDEGAPPVAMPHNTTTVIQQAPVQQRQQRQQTNIPTGGLRALAKMAKDYIGPGDVTGTGPSTPGYSLGMDVSGDLAMIQADKLEGIGGTSFSSLSETGVPTLTENLQAVSSSGAVVPEAAAAEAGTSSMSLAGLGATGAGGMIGGKLGSYFGNWVGEKAGVGGERDRKAVGGVVGGAVTGAGIGAMAGGIGAIPGAAVGGIAGLLSTYF